MRKNSHTTSDDDIQIFDDADQYIPASQFAPTHSFIPTETADHAPVTDMTMADDPVIPHLLDLEVGSGRTSGDFFADLSMLLGASKGQLFTPESTLGPGNGAIASGLLPAEHILAVEPLVSADPVPDAGSSPSIDVTAPVFAAEAMLLAPTPAGAKPVIGGTAPQQAFKQLWKSTDVPTDAMFSQQWNLHNTGQTGGVKGVDINVLPAWAMGYTGKGVSIGVFDTAVDATHADLVGNIDLSKIITGSMVADHAFVDPTRITSSAVDSHATAVSGIIAAAKDGQGIVGVAYDAKFTPVDTVGAQSGNYGWEALMQQYRFDVTNNSWGFTTPFSVGQLDASSQYWVLSGFKTGADQGRGGLGTIEVLAAGNYRQTGMTTELTGVTVDRHAITVGATDDRGSVAYYSNGGASVLVVAPSSGLSNGITTDDITGALGYSSGNFTNTFGGTSAATPQISGVVALMLQANPLLGWRDVQDILAISARHVGTAINNGISGYEQDAWSFNHATNVNGGGMHFSNDYGFGLVDAAAAVRLAVTWGAVHTVAGTSANEIAASSSIAGNWDVGHAHTTVLNFNIGTHESVQSMVLDLNNLKFNDADHLTITLTSPTGTESQLLVNNGGSSATIASGWEFMSREFLGEDAFGSWKVSITSNNGADIGTLSSAKLTAYGSSLSNNSVAYYTDEFGTYANADPTRAMVGSNVTAIDAASVTGATNINLSTKVASIDGKAISLGVDSHVTTVIAGGGDSVLVANNFGNRLYGGQGNDILSGGSGADYLDGGRGNNIINTGAGADQVVMHTNAFNTIVDFAVGIDKMLFSKTEFTAFASKGIDASSFILGTSASHVTGGGFVYDQAHSTLYYDADGHSALMQIAQMSNAAALKANDLVLIA